jgi:hypothetical protein
MNELNLEEKFQDLFRTSVSATGEEELLRIASTYSRQLTAQQIRLILLLEYLVFDLPERSAKKIQHFVHRWLELKQYNNSDAFVMKALEFISLRKFLNENSFKVDIQK